MSFVSYFPGRGTVRETAYREGRAEGEAKGVLFVLEARGTWVERSRTVERVEDLFGEGVEAAGDRSEQG
ncbi:hypothetical protein ABZ896_06440 [Streptomyces sp. NPDC047072]|uniref:hypothetical protein n=1 Tax=Streptomyces sp. NPDC047072 TaxID=3154809 RepID=UPI0033EF7DC5